MCVWVLLRVREQRGGSGLGWGGKGGRKIDR